MEVNRRNISTAFGDSDVLIFFGSQTGTAEDYARRLGSSISNDYDLKPIVHDLEDYDMDTLNQVFGIKTASGKQVVVCFVLATYGDGEPTDNATELHTFLGEESPDFPIPNSKVIDNDQPLQGLPYLAFGAGNSTYEHYNFMGRYVHRNLQRLGADIVGELGEGDDGTGTMDEDFLSWKARALEDLALHMGVSRIEQGYKSSLEIKEIIDSTCSTNGVVLAGGNIAPQSNHRLTQPPYTYKNPYFAQLSYTRHLFAPTCARHCLHIEFDISGTDLSYQTGDHVGVWPVNSEPEIDRLLHMLDLSGKGDQVISLASVDPKQSQSTILPSPTTYASILRYYLEIQGRVSRELVSTLAPMAPTTDSKALMAKLGSEKDYFKNFVTDRCLTLGLLLEVVSAGKSWSNIPFVLLLESLPPLQPRYYSISSSSSLHPTKIHLTAAVKTERFSGEPRAFKGLTTNYLMALCTVSNKDIAQSPEVQANQYRLPCAELAGIRSPIHVRESKFRLPPNHKTPIIMIGPGTGVAPFRGFLQERSLLRRQGVDVGQSVLFTGCRRHDEDFLYGDEWEEMKVDLKDRLDLYTAFSREEEKKVYVQDRIAEQAGLVRKLLTDSGAWLYICGDGGRMAKDVKAKLDEVISGQAKGKDTIQGLKDQGRFHVSASYRILRFMLKYIIGGCMVIILVKSVVLL